MFTGKSEMDFKIMAYQQFAIKGGKIEQEGVKLITADYDILATAGSRGFCLDYDLEGLEIFVRNRSVKSVAQKYKEYSRPIKEEDQEDFSLYVQKRLEASIKIPIDRNSELFLKKVEELCSDQAMIVEYNRIHSPHMIAEYELAKAKERCDIISAEINGHSPFIGNVSFEGASVVGYLTQATGGGVGHGQETGNFSPEKFTDEPFIAFDSKGESYELQGEKGACDFINWQRSKGFPIDVSPKWGWRLNSDGQLEVPDDKKLNWDDLDKKIKELSSSLQDQNSGMEDYAMKEEGFNLGALEVLRDSRVELERIRLEAPLTYVDLADEGMSYDSASDKSNLQNQVKELYAKNWRQRFDAQLKIYGEAFDSISPQLQDEIGPNWNYEQAKLETDRKMSNDRPDATGQVGNKRVRDPEDMVWAMRVRLAAPLSGNAAASGPEV